MRRAPKRSKYKPGTRPAPVDAGRDHSRAQLRALVALRGAHITEPLFLEHFSDEHTAWDRAEAFAKVIRDLRIPALVSVRPHKGGKAVYLVPDK